VYPNRRNGSDRKIESLRALPLLQSCSTGELLRLGAAAESAELPSGSTLKVEGRKVGWVHIVVEGDVVKTCNGRVLEHGGPGTLVGETELLARSPSADSVTSVTHVRALVFGRREFLAVLDTCPAFRDTVLRSLSHQAVAAAAQRPVLASVHNLVRIREQAVAN
jgi:CRP-like cAMP-binding protein